MVLVMQSHVISEYIQRSVVRECLRHRRAFFRNLLLVFQYLRTIENVVLRDEVSGTGM